MRIIRRHTTELSCPYAGIKLTRLGPDSTNRPGQNPPESPNETQPGFDYPEDWSRPAGIAASTRAATVPTAQTCFPIPEEDVPKWLWRREPHHADSEETVEKDIFQIIDRVVGGWCYQGWKAGYFDAVSDARSYYDEVRWLLVHRRFSPDPAEWKYTGLFWAYGISATQPACCIGDWRSGAIRPAAEQDLPPYGTIINGPDISAADAAGLRALCDRDLTAAEQDLDVSSNPCVPEQDGLALQNHCDASPHIRRGMTIEAANAQSLTILSRQRTRPSQHYGQIIGDNILREHMQAVIDAWPDGLVDDVTHFPALAAAVRVAQNLPVPAPILEPLLEGLRAGQQLTPDDLIGPPAPEPLPDQRLYTVRFDEGGPSAFPAVANSVARIIQDGFPVRVLYADHAETDFTCPSAGSVRSPSLDGGLLFGDDIQTGCAALNLNAFVAADGTPDTDGLSHAVELAVLSLDFSADMASTATPRIAKRRWDYRPLHLSISGLGEALKHLSNILPDNRAARVVAGLCACTTGYAWKTSSALAEERGAFPKFSDCQDSISDVLSRTEQKAGQIAAELDDSVLADAVRTSWTGLLVSASENGIRHSHMTSIGTAGRTKVFMDCEPLNFFEVVTRTTETMQALDADEMPETLSTLDYSDHQIQNILEHLVGRHSLENAPGVNHSNLRKRGFTEAALHRIEDALVTATDLSQCFSISILGEPYCREHLLFDDTDLTADDFDMLAALGYSDAGIEAANLWCFGKDCIESAPFLSDEHKALLSTSEAIDPLDLAALVQGVISGGIGTTLTIGASTGVTDILTILDNAWKKGLKTLTLGPASDQAKQGIEIIFAEDRPQEAGSERSSRNAPFPAPVRSAASVSSSADAASEQRHH